MSETFRIEEFESIESRERKDIITNTKNEKNRNKLKNFDEAMNEIEVGNRRVEKGLRF